VRRLMGRGGVTMAVGYDGGSAAGSRKPVWLVVVPHG
jgi:hypothetical protein